MTVLLGTGWLALQSPSVQTSLVDSVISKLGGSISGTIKVGKVSINPLNSFTISDILILDENPFDKAAPADTFVAAKTISGKISFRSLISKKGIYLSRVKVEDGYLHLITEPDVGSESGSTSNMARIFHLVSQEREDGYSPTPDIFQVNKVMVKDFRFRMTNYASPLPDKPGAINWTDMDLTASARVRSLKYTGGRMSGIVDKLSARESRSGYAIDNLTGRARVGMGKATVENLRLTDPWSDVKIGLFSMGWKNSQKDFQDYLNKIRHELTISSGNLSARTIYAFAGVPDSMDLDLDLGKSRAYGYINDLNIDRLRVSEAASGVKADVSTTLTGLTDAGNMLIDAKVNSLDFTTEGLGVLLKKLGIKADLGNLAPGKEFSFTGSASGPVNNLKAEGELSSGIGRADFNMGIRNLAKAGSPIDIAASVRSRGLDLGSLAGVDALGELTANTEVRARIDGAKTSVSVDTLKIDKINLMGYGYTGLTANGRYTGNSFDGRLTCTDPNLQLVFDGIAQLPGKNRGGRFKFDADIAHADLQALGFDKRGTSKVSGHINADVITTAEKDLLGDVLITGLQLENDLGRNAVGDIILSSTSDNGENRVAIHSDFLDGGFSGTGRYDRIFKDLQTITTRRELPSIYSVKDKDTGDSGNSYRLNLDFHDSRKVLAFALPGLYIADSTRITMHSSGGDLEGEAVSPRLAWHTNYLKDVKISFDNFGKSLNATVLSSDMNLGGVGFSNSALSAFAQEDNIFAGFHYDGIRGLDNVGEIYLTGDISRDLSDTLCVRANPLSSYLRFNSQQWDMDESQIVYRAGSVLVDGFRMHNGDQVISIDGGIASKELDTLTVGIRNVDLSAINYFTKEDYDIRGRTSGRALLSIPRGGNIRALANITCDSLMVSGNEGGTVRCAAIWDGGNDMVNVYLRNLVDGQESISASGSYRPEAGLVDLTARLDGMNLVLARPFLQGLLDDMSGGISGYITAGGSLDELNLSSENARIDNARFKVAYTGVSYTIDGPLHIDNEGIHFDDITITDDKSGSAVLTGGIGVRGINDIMLAAGLRLYGLEVLDIRNPGSLSGNLFANGSVQVSGPVSSILVDADVSTAGAGNLLVPIGGAASASRSDLLTFTSHKKVFADPYEDMLAALSERKDSKKGTSGTDLSARIRVSAHPGLEATVELDDTGDNSLRVRGDGALGINFRPSKGILDISGDYNIAQGSYRFAVPGIVSKDFTIDNGSSISFNGDILASLLDIGATYSLRTSLGNLIADTTSTSSRRMVDCGIKITDRLSSPDVKFSIDIPDLDPTTKAEVQSALNTEDKIQKQFVALLVTGSFLPNEQSGIVNNPNILYSNVSEIMSRQLSNILNRLDIPLDMGLGYQQSNSGTDLFDVAVSTELFNKRVVVNGTVGNRQYSNSHSAQGDLVGDLDIDVKLDRPGQLRINLFSHSADEYSSYLDLSQRNGAGITYQKEFNTWKDFFRNLFRGRRRRDQRQPEESVPTVTTTIDE